MKLAFGVFIFSSSIFLSMLGYADYPQSTQSSVAQEQQLEDNQIINIMMTVDKGEIEASHAALKKEVSPSVKSYANYLIDQHQRNFEALAHLAKQLSLQPKESAISNALIEGGKHDHESMENLHGRAYDKAFIDTMVKGHKAGLKLIDSKLSPQAKNPLLKASVEKFRNMVSNHLQKALEIQRSL